MNIHPHRQEVPQVILAGVPLDPFSKDFFERLDALHAKVINAPVGADTTLAFLQLRMFQRVIDRHADAEFGHTGVWENGRELSFEELAAEGFSA